MLLDWTKTQSHTAVRVVAILCKFRNASSRQDIELDAWR